MAAYLIIDLDIHDREGFQEYREGIGGFIAKHGREYLARAGEFELIALCARRRRFVVAEGRSKGAILARNRRNLGECQFNIPAEIHFVQEGVQR